MKFLYGTRRKNTPTANWRAASDYARKIKTPAAILGNNTDTDYPRAIARFVECKALFGGTTTFAGLAAKDGHNYVGLVRNIEFPDRATWPVAIGHINDFESVKEAEQELGPILNDQVRGSCSISRKASMTIRAACSITFNAQMGRGCSPQSFSVSTRLVWHRMNFQ